VFNWEASLYTVQQLSFAVHQQIFTVYWRARSNTQEFDLEPWTTIKAFCACIGKVAVCYAQADDVAAPLQNYAAAANSSMKYWIACTRISLIAMMLQNECALLNPIEVVVYEQCEQRLPAVGMTCNHNDDGCTAHTMVLILLCNTQCLYCCKLLSIDCKLLLWAQ
jgi:hypothetical protein